MSVGNWSVCPMCARKESSRVLRIFSALDGQYGKISESEYIELTQLSKEYRDPGFTLREESEMRTGSDGVFKVKYHSLCIACDFSFDFAHEEDAMSPEVCWHEPCENKVTDSGFCSESCREACWRTRYHFKSNVGLEE